MIYLLLVMQTCVLPIAVTQSMCLGRSA